MNRLRRAALVLVAAVAVLPVPAPPAFAASYVPVSGSGSTWSATIIQQWVANVDQFGIKVSYADQGSSTGRRDFREGLVDYAVTEIPYGLRDAQGVYDTPPSRGFAYLPVVAGGTSFMYNLVVGGKRVTNLRLSGQNVTKIFTGEITRWDDPALSQDNPKIALPPKRIVPVVRSDGSGTTAQFTSWMAKEHPSFWNAFCTRQGIRYSGTCPFTSNYPAAKGFVSQSGSLGVSGFVKGGSAEGAITYVEYSYPVNARFPVVKLLNRDGYYVEPTDEAVAVGLLGAKINQDKSNRDTYLTQILDGVYRNPDRRAYPMSSYSYMVIPTAEGGTFKTDKGRTLGDFLYFAICEGQQAAGVLGYSPLPQNLVQAGFEQIRLIPGVDARKISPEQCNNPTFSKDGTNTLARTAPMPPACDAQGMDQCLTGTGGARDRAAVPTPRAAPVAGAGDTPSGGGAGGGAPTGAGAPGAGAPGGGLAGGGGAGSGGTTAPAIVDPLTGTPVGSVSAADVTRDPGDALVTGMAVMSPAVAGSVGHAWYMVLATVMLLLAVVGPPVVLRRGSRA